jgi:O-antigen/teichoic acid export membrane protein
LKIQEHIDKISWTFADKGIYVLFGFFTIVFHIRYLSPEDYGLFTHLNNLNIWILVISDGFALMNIIQFGAKEENRGKVNLIALLIHLSLTLGISLILYSLSDFISDIFSEPRMNEVMAYLPILVLFNVPRTYCMKFIYRDRKFKKLFILDSMLFGSMMITTLILVFSMSYLALSDMIIIYFTGTFLASLSAILLTRRELTFSIKGNIKAFDLIKFGIPLTLYNTLHSIPRNMDYFVVQYFFSTATVGIYSSAKQLFRFFEEAIIAANSMIYPVAVFQLERKDIKGFNDLITKSISFTFFTFLALIIFFELGFANIVIDILLPEKYSLALGHFRILIFGAIFFPFLMLTSIITASGKPNIVLLFVVISLIVWVVAFIIIGYTGETEFISIAMLCYLCALGILSIVYTKFKFGINTKEFFRAFKDTKNFLYSYFGRNKS